MRRSSNWPCNEHALLSESIRAMFESCETVSGPAAGSLTPLGPPASLVWPKSCNGFSGEARG